MIKFYHVTYHVNLPNHPIIQRGAARGVSSYNFSFLFSLFFYVCIFGVVCFFQWQCLRPPLNGEAFALSTSLSYCCLIQTKKNENQNSWIAQKTKQTKKKNGCFRTKPCESAVLSLVAFLRASPPLSQTTCTNGSESVYFLVSKKMCTCDHHWLYSNPPQYRKNGGWGTVFNFLFSIARNHDEIVVLFGHLCFHPDGWASYSGSVGGVPASTTTVLFFCCGRCAYGTPRASFPFLFFSLFFAFF